MITTLAAFGTVSGWTGVLAYLAMVGFTIYHLRTGTTGRALLLATTATLAFAASLLWVPTSTLSGILELTYEAAWILFVARILRIAPEPGDSPGFRGQYPSQIRGIIWLCGALAVSGSMLLVYSTYSPDSVIAQTPQLLGAVQTLQSALGLVMLEQAIRNGRKLYQWRSRILYIGIATIFVYALIKHSLALLLKAPALEFVVMHGFVLALSVPVIMVGSLRNRHNELRLNISHEFIFRSGTLLLTGLFLMSLGVLGYYVRLLGDWLSAAYAVAATAALIAFAVLFGSKPLRRRLRVLVSKTLFEYKYDYRHEWLSLTEQMSQRSPDLSVPEQGLEALLNVSGSHAGGIWQLQNDALFMPMANINADWETPLPPSLSADIVQFYEAMDWVIDLQQVPVEAQALQDFASRSELQAARFVIPMFAGKRLFGLAVLVDTPKITDMNWEDYDLLKLIANQVAQIISLQVTDRELQETRQFQAINQMSAFVVHDLKTISAQLDLLLHNADTHRNNPAFIDDMFATVANSVERMQHLLHQLRSETASSDERLDLNALMAELEPRFEKASPVPQWHLANEPVWLTSNAQRLRSALTHLIQNAVQATPVTGSVEIRLRRSGEWVTIEIMDTGLGMSARFIEDRLFQPFDSTKGVSGMGIGAYQAREYIRGLGGDLQVTSTLEEGSNFIIRLPMGEG